MDTALPQKFLFILDRNLAKANCTGNRVCTPCDTVVLDIGISQPFSKYLTPPPPPVLAARVHPVLLLQGEPGQAGPQRHQQGPLLQGAPQGPHPGRCAELLPPGQGPRQLRSGGPRAAGHLHHRGRRAAPRQHPLRR